MRFAPPMYSSRRTVSPVLYRSARPEVAERFVAALSGLSLFAAFVAVWTAVFLLALR